MFLIQQSSSFRVWTSRALMIYFRRALLFLVVRPRQNRNHHHYLSQKQQQQKVCFSDAEDDEEILMIDDKRELAESLFDRNQSKHHLLKEYFCKEVTQGLNNSMSKSIETSSMISDSAQLPGTEHFEPSTHNLYQRSKTLSIKTVNNIEIDESKVPDDSVYQYQTKTSHLSWQQTPHQNRINPMLSSPSYTSCHALSFISRSFDNKTLSCESSLSELPVQYPSTSIRENLSSSSDDEDDIYEKYQTSFSHILHQTRSLQTIRQEDKLHSMLVLEPNTSIITVRPLTYHPFNPNTLSYSMFTNHICVRLIANQIDSSIQCDTKPIGCKKRSSNNIIKSTSTNNEQQNPTPNKELQATSILINTPYKTLYIDT